MKIRKLFLIAIIAGIMPVCAQGEAQGLKDVYTDFKFGNILNGSTSNNQIMKELVLKEFNSITPENELKPDQTMVQSGSTDDDIKVQLNTGARRILKFCEDNNIGVRGHTLVWHAQTPAWFFRENLTNSGALADSETMDKRMESYIKNIFALIEKDFPNLNLYAYDVVNEAFKNNGGGLREAGTGGGQSPWTQIYGNDQFIVNAFKYARMYAPANCKLFYNDYNEYMPDKRNDIYNLAMKLKEEDLIDGIGMQSHLHLDSPDYPYPNFPTPSSYKEAVKKFAETGLEVQITELDVTTNKTNVSNNFSAQAQRYKEIMEAILAYKESVTAVVVWGITDDRSWRSAGCPVLFDAEGYRKTAYDELYFLATGDYPPPIPGVEPDENGYYFYNTFEDGTMQSWTSRGGSVANTSKYAYEGTKSIFVSNRTAEWHGVERALNSRAFKPDDAYSFGAMAMCPDDVDEGTFKLTLQCNVGGETRYEEVAQVPAVKGEWIELLNPEFEIPTGATNLLLYVEMPGLSTTEFYIDQVFGGIAGIGNSAPKIQSGSSLKAWTNDNQLHVTGISEGKPWHVYSVTGILVYQGIAAGNITTATLNMPSGMYVVWTEEGTVKIIL